MKSNKTIISREAGFTSMIIALVLILVIALISVGFAQLARHEQQQSLSNQLATQANYAAETGVNDIAKAIRENSNALPGVSNVNSDKCIDLAQLKILTSSDSSLSSGAAYTCAIVSLQPDDLKATTNADSGHTFLASTYGGASISTLTFEWQSHDSRTNIRPASDFGKLFPAAQWSASNSPAVVELSITPLNGTHYDRSTLQNNTFTSYLYPDSPNPGNINFTTNAASQSQFVHGDCVAAGPSRYQCLAKINLGGQAGPYLIHYIPYYDATDVRVTAVDSSGTAIKFIGAQATIDVTGKSQNVLKRIQVRVPLFQGSDLANYALEAQNVCKRLETRPGTTTFYDINNNVNATPSCL